MTTETQPQQLPRARTWRSRLRRTVLFLALLAVALVAGGPTLLSTPAVSGWVLSRLFADVHGSVTAERLQLGWFSAPRIAGLEIRSPSNEPVISIGSVAAEQPLWQLISHPAEIGHVTVERPHATLILTPEGSNFSATFHPNPNRKLPARWRQEAMQLDVSEGAFTWQLAASAHRWSVDNMQLNVRLLPVWLSETHDALLQVEPTTVLDHVELSTGMCDDVLKFIAPALAAATTTSGNFSLSLAEGNVPLERLRDCQLQGVLTLHTVQVGLGPWFDRFVPFVQKFLPSINTASLVNVTHESNVRFEVANQRVHHEGLEFGISDVTVRTSGYVGFDESLDLVAEIKLQLPETSVAERPVLRALNGRVMRVPVKGTLKHPEIDWGNRPELRQGLLAALVGKSLPGDASALTDQLKSSGILSSQEGETSPAAELGVAAGELVKRLIERRRERKQEQEQAEQQAEQVNPQAPAPADESPAAPPPEPSGDSSQNSAPESRRPILGAALRALADVAADAAAPQNQVQQDQQAQAGSPANPPAPPAPSPVAPLPSSQQGPSLAPPANAGAGNSGSSKTQQSNTQLPAAASSPPVAPTKPAQPATAASTPAPVTPSGKLPQGYVPPPPLLQTPLPAATGAQAANAPGNPQAATPQPPAPPAENQLPRRRIGRALRALMEQAEGAQTPPAANPPVAPPVGPPAGPQASVPPGSPDAPRYPVLRRALRAALDAALDAASQPQATPAQPTPAPPRPAPPASTDQPAPAPESLPAPTPAPTPAPE